MTSSPTPEWIEPTQARSKKKVRQIEQAARDLLLETGSLDLKMTEVAKRAQVPVGTLYQFFPSRTALVQKLFALEMRQIDESVAETFFAIEDLTRFGSQLEQLLHQQIELVQSDPAMMVIWGSAVVDPVIQDADRINTQQNAAVLAERLTTELGPKIDPRAAHATALIICHLWSSIIRLCAQTSEDSAKDIVREYAKMMTGHIHRLQS